MAKARSKTERFPELREFIQENDQRLYDFCVYMLYGAGSLDDLILSIFRDFGDTYRKMSLRAKDSSWELLELKIGLFQIAWERVREHIARLQHVFPLATTGRDT